MVALVFWFLLRHEVSRMCVHLQWDPELGGYCTFCDTGMST